MSKSRKKNIKDRFEKKKLIATKHKKKYPKTEKKNEDKESLWELPEEAEEIFLQELRHEDTSN